MNFIVQRHLTVKSEIETVRNQLRHAQEKYDEFSSKLKAIDAEVAALREQAKQDTVNMKQRILAETRRITHTIASDAKKGAEGLFLELKTQLYAELSGRVLDRAEQILRERLTGDDRVRIQREFSRQVESVQ